MREGGRGKAPHRAICFADKVCVVFFSFFLLCVVIIMQRLQ